MSRQEARRRPRGKSLKPLRTLVPFIRPYAGIVALAVVALLLASSAMLAMPVALRHLIDQGLQAEQINQLNRYFGWFLLATIMFSIFAAFRYYLVTWVGERVVADIRNAVYARVINMDPAFFEITRTGEVLSRLTTDTTLVQSISGVGISIALRSFINLAGGLLMMVGTSFTLSAYVLLGIPVVLLPVVVVGRRIRRLSRHSQDRIADTSGLAGETLGAMQTVQAFTLENLQTERYGKAVRESFHAAVKRLRMSAFLTATSFALIFGTLTFLMWVGVSQVMDGTLTVGELGQFLMYAVLVGGSATMLSGLWGEVQRAAGAMERLSELLETQPAIAPPSRPLRFEGRASGRVRFQHVHFNYPSRPDQLAMDDFDLEVEPGETVAFVGPSGAGKSTAFQLLLRFYDAQKGKILIDDLEVRDVDPRELRQQMALVPQETILFGESAMENIRYGRPDASDEAVHRAAELAAADEFIRDLPDGYHTFLGEKGIRLSGGQRQRIAIARAILKDPPILLLDEATSSLDAESERLVQEALEGLMKNRTTLVIAHRLATVKKVDRIVVMSQGRIEAVGNHQDLARDNALYARLAELQFGDL